MKPQLGTSLIEVLVSLSLLTLIVLGLDAMQFYSLRTTKTAYYVSIAQQQINNMVERLQILPNSSIQDEIKNWNQQNEKVLPQGKGEITVNNNHFTIILFWGKEAKPTCEKSKTGLSGCLKRDIGFIL